MTLPPLSAALLLLVTFVNQPQPWLAIEANSEQRQPIYLGHAPRELALGPQADPGTATLPLALRGVAERKIGKLARKLGLRRLEVELWPTQNDQGKITWAFARYRPKPSSPWRWIDAADAPSSEANATDPETFFPILYRPWVEKERAQLFDDFLTLDDLYAKPVWGDCIWSTEQGMAIAGAWLPLTSLEELRAQALASHLVCRVLPQPARLDGRPYELTVRALNGALSWPSTLSWTTPRADAPPIALPSRPISSWPPGLEARYRSDVLVLAGERPAPFPLSGDTMRFTRKNSADPGNELLQALNYLEQRYAEMGIATRRESFAWRGVSQANLIALLPGTAPGHERHPVLLADHYDTAFCEDRFAQTGERISAPGADDNASATAALLAAAPVLRDRPHARDIWLVHLTGEEFPGDDLGARKLVSQLLNDRQDLGGLVLMDMIGWRKKDDGIFQISAGDSGASLQLAGVALGSAFVANPGGAWLPVLRTRSDDRSYLYNTDGLIFSDAGYPVILLNEHLNYYENLNRSGYHQTTDGPAKVDFGYATAITRAAIQTADALANTPDF